MKNVLVEPFFVLEICLLLLASASFVRQMVMNVAMKPTMT